MDAWLKKAAPMTNVKPKPATGLNYSKFDKIVDSDDEEDAKQAKKQQPPRQQAAAANGGKPPGFDDMPQHVKSTYARVAMAQERNDERGYKSAMHDLETALQKMPAEWKSKMQANSPIAMQQRAAKMQNAASKLGSEGQMLAQHGQLDSQLKKLEEAQNAIAAMAEDPSQMPKWLESVGITPEQIAAAENAEDSNAAMTALARSAMEMQLSGVVGKGLSSAAMGAASAAPVGESEEMKAARRGLEEQQRKLAAAEAELATQRAAVAKASAVKTKNEAALAEAEEKKREQGLKVDESVEGARADLVTQAGVLREQEEERMSLINSFRERGNLAMQRGDLTAARSFYSEALDVPRVPFEERAKLLGNRAACLLALKRPDLAVADAEGAAELMPESGKAHYRLGCLQDEVGDGPGAIASLTRAVELLAAADVASRLSAVKANEEAMAEAVRSADGPLAQAEAEAALAEARSNAAAAAEAMAARKAKRTAARVLEFASNPATREEAAAAQEASEEQEDAASDAAIKARAAKVRADAARKRVDEMRGKCEAMPTEATPTHEFAQSDGSIVLKVSLPELSSLGEAEVEISDDSFYLHAPSLYRLQLQWPQAVSADEAKAKFVRKSHTLQVTLPLVV